MDICDQRRVIAAYEFFLLFSSTKYYTECRLYRYTVNRWIWYIHCNVYAIYPVDLRLITIFCSFCMFQSLICMCRRIDAYVAYLPDRTRSKLSWSSDILYLWFHYIYIYCVGHCRFPLFVYKVVHCNMFCAYMCIIDVIPCI